MSALTDPGPYFERRILDPKDLIPTRQMHELNPAKVKTYMERYKNGEELEIQVRELDGKLFILDGHHRVVASQLLGCKILSRVQVMRNPENG
jgi:hypothetical protein